MTTPFRSDYTFPVGVVVFFAGLVSISGKVLAGPSSFGDPPSSAPYAYCWATREVEGSAKRVYYFSRVWAMPSDGPTVGFQPQFQSFVSARYSSRGGASAQCLRFYGRQETEQHLNNLAGQARRNGNEVEFTNWWPR